jgi:hypothetical protein
MAIEKVEQMFRSLDASIPLEKIYKNPSVDSENNQSPN